jgi:hypothetical protein
MTTENEKQRSQEPEETKEKNNKTPKFSCWNNPIERYTLFLAIFTLGLIIVGVLQLLTLEKTDETSRFRDRAFINFSDPVIRRFPNYDPPRLTINVAAQNTGNVPARNVSISYDCVIVDNSKNITDPFPTAKFSPVQIPRFIGPKQIIGFAVRDDTQTFFDSIMNGEIKVFIIVKAEYLDGFDSHFPRVTQMSRQLHVDKSKLHSFSFAGSHNCIDEDCK